LLTLAESLRPRRPELQGAAFFVFDEEAGVFDYEETTGAGFFGGCGVGDSELQPQSFGADGDGGIGNGRDSFGAAEDVDDVNGDGDVFETGVGFFAEYFPFVRIDGNDAIADGLEVSGDFVGRTGGIGGEADYGDGFGGAEELGDEVGGRKGVVWEMEEHGRLDVGGKEKDRGESSQLTVDSQQ